MAVVTRYATGFQDPAVKPADLLASTEVAGHNKSLVSTVETVNGDSATSVYKFGKIPSNARIGVNSLLENDAIAGMISFDVGEKTTANCLVAARNVTAGGSVAGAGAVNIDSRQKPFWKIAGYAVDPGGELEVIGTVNVAPTAAGTLTLTLIFEVDN